ncbi:MAG TPA: 50S ribosomal protein L21 [Spirochaetota bacterium]|nr:50S ribosomal protein L21 [Spirochaetota bacterium]
MYSIVEIKGKQYQAVPGGYITVDRIDASPGESYTDFKVLLHKDKQEKIAVGTPYLDNVKIKATITAEIRGPKVTAYRYKPKSRYTKKRGNKQRFTRLKIESISAA